LRDRRILRGLSGLLTGTAPDDLTVRIQKEAILGIPEIRQLQNRQRGHRTRLEAEHGNVARSREGKVAPENNGVKANALFAIQVIKENATALREKELTG